MKVYIVASTAASWMNTGFGHSLLHADAEDLLVSFAEFSAKPQQQLAVTTMQFPYEVNKDAKPQLIASTFSFFNPEDQP